MGKGTPIAWPGGKGFAFTAFDDADYDRLENTKPVYDLLAELGILTTKSAWVLAGQRESRLSGLSCEDPRYCEWIKSLQCAGFEIGWHNARYHSSTREDTIAGLERFRELFGHYPRTMSNHFQNKDSIYWGAARLTGMSKVLYQAANFRRRNELDYQGHIMGSPFFWGDRCKESVDYVRNFVYREINTLKACPQMPYRDARMPYVNAWYASAEGGEMESFVQMLTEANQDRLAEEGGLCIMYTHFAKGFVTDGLVNRRFEALMRRLAGLGGWYAPVGVVLDYLKAQKGIALLTDGERGQLERNWLFAKLRHGSS